MSKSQKTAPERVSLIGAPTDVGAGRRGSSMGPEALRVAGLHKMLRGLGMEVVDRGDLIGPLNPEEKPVNGYRNLKEVAAWNGLVRDAMYEALKDGDFPILMGGDHCLAVGSIAGVAKHCHEAGKSLSVLWLDAHADFNTPDTSPSGNIHGMPIACLAGHGPKELTGLGHAVPILDPTNVIQVGIRSVDAAEKELVAENGLTVYDMRQIDEHGMRRVMDMALAKAAEAGGHMHVSFDVDFLDPSIAPGVPTTVPGGPNYREAQLCMEMIYDSGLTCSLDIMELNPAFDRGNMTAELAVELVSSLFGEQTLARTHSNRKYSL
ncbi:arginase [Aestuariispira insulae]|uniref:Arginase n=1 Tax=Aestuariispira insulae TaxID=1461337 RepID=A0A3D9HV85_9PROT|nr:arginase [Aestuariispira insulae]RED53434.1 arginase [Aestuariispira insulae]